MYTRIGREGKGRLGMGKNREGKKGKECTVRGKERGIGR